jgi:integrase
MLTETKIKRILPRGKDYKLSDGEGLYLRVTVQGKKFWRFQYYFAGKPKSISLGKYPTVSLFEAREKRRKAQELINKRIDPSLRRQAEKRELIVAHESKLHLIAQQWWDVNKPRWCDKHQVKTWRRLELHLFPTLGNFPVSEIKASDLLRVMQRVQKKSTDNAHRLIHSCEGIFGYALVLGLITYNPVRDIKRLLLPNIEGRFPVIPVEELHEFLVRFRDLKARPQDKIAFKLLLLTGLRTKELRYSRWADIDLNLGCWRIKSEMMKVKDQGDHIVPLSKQAIYELDNLKELTGHQDWLFPSRDTRRNPVMCENMINLMIEAMGYKGRMVGHSFRKLFSTIMHEHHPHSLAIEKQLAHKDKNRIRDIYNHARYYPIRKQLMQWWADYLDAVIDNPSLCDPLLFHMSTEPQLSGVQAGQTFVQQYPLLAN